MTPRPRPSLLDLVGAALAALSIAAIWIVQLAIVPVFAGMFEDFGGPLPAPTRAVIAPVVALASSAAIVGLVGLGLGLRTLRADALGTLVVAVAVLTGMLVPPLMVALLYLPVWQLAGAIR